MKKCCGVLRIAVGITMLALLLVGSANAVNLTVCPNGCEYSKIQKAINASSNGDTILVQSGTYFENVNITKQLTLRGIGNPVVDAGGSGSAITLAADGITLEGFTATGSGYNNYESPSPDAGIKVTSSNNTLNGNSANSNNNYGFYLVSSNNNTMRYNKASNNELGISLDSSYNNTLTGNNASNNYFGILLDYSSNNTLTGNIVSNNSAGISLSSSSNNNTLTGNNISNNWNSSGISLYSSSNNVLSGNNVSNNYDGIHLVESDNNMLSGNNASNHEIAGIHLYASSNSTLSDNRASNNGYFGGIWLYDSSSNTLTGNIASNNYGNYGYGISLSSSSNNTLSGNSVSNNNKGIYLYNSSKNRINDNIFSNTKNIEIHKSKINTWNTTSQSGTNIIGGSLLGGNFWGYPNGTGFSQTCPDVNGDRICDESYTLDAKNIDYLPLAKDKIPPKSVRNLKNITYTRNYINWTWKDPKDIDFKKVMVFMDGEMMES